MKSNMKRAITIANGFIQQSAPLKMFKIKINGGSPWYGYLWIDDVCFIVRKTGMRGSITVKQAGLVRT